MSTPIHFRDVPDASTAYDRLAKTDIASAVRYVVGRGLSIQAEDIPTPCLIQLARLEKGLRAQYALDRAFTLGSERAALQICEGQANIRRAAERPAVAHDTHAADIRARVAAGQATAAHILASKEAWIRDRVAALEAEHFACLKAEWTRVAIAEAAERFAVAPPAASPVAEPSPVQRRNRKQAA